MKQNDNINFSYFHIGGGYWDCFIDGVFISRLLFQSDNIEEVCEFFKKFKLFLIKNYNIDNQPQVLPNC